MSGDRMIGSLMTLIHDLRRMIASDRREWREIARLDAEIENLLELREEFRWELALAERSLEAAHKMTVRVEDLLGDAEYEALLAAAPDWQSTRDPRMMSP